MHRHLVMSHHYFYFGGPPSSIGCSSKSAEESSDSSAPFQHVCPVWLAPKESDTPRQGQAVPTVRLASTVGVEDELGAGDPFQCKRLQRPCEAGGKVVLPKGKRNVQGIKSLLAKVPLRGALKGWAVSLVSRSKIRLTN